MIAGGIALRNLPLFTTLEYMMFARYEYLYLNFSSKTACAGVCLAVMTRAEFGSVEPGTVVPFRMLQYGGQIFTIDIKVGSIRALKKRSCVVCYVQQGRVRIYVGPSNRKHNCKSRGLWCRSGDYEQAARKLQAKLHGPRCTGPKSQPRWVTERPRPQQRLTLVFGQVNTRAITAKYSPRSLNSDTLRCCENCMQSAKYMRKLLKS